MIKNLSDFPLLRPEFFHGDVFDPPPPLSDQVRLRVRGIEQVTDFGPWMKSPKPVLQYVLQLYTITGSGQWAWYNQDHDIKMTAERIREANYRLESKAEGQLGLF